MFDDAIDDADAAVRLEPDDCDSYLARGAVYAKTGKYEQAIFDLTRYIDEVDVSGASGQHASRAFCLRGIAYAGLRDFRQAIKDDGRSINRWPDWPEPYEARAEAYESIGDHHIFSRDGIEEILNVQPRGSQAKAYQVKQVRGVILRYGLGEELA